MTRSMLDTASLFNSKTMRGTSGTRDDALHRGALNEADEATTAVDADATAVTRALALAGDAAFRGMAADGTVALPTCGTTTNSFLHFVAMVVRRWPGHCDARGTAPPFDPAPLRKPLPDGTSHHHLSSFFFFLIILTTMIGSCTAVSKLTDHSCYTGLEPETATYMSCNSEGLTGA